jgi:hypothetical protein
MKKNSFKFTWLFSRLSDVVVSVLDTGPRDVGSNPAEVMDFLMALKIHNTPFFRWEIKLEAPRPKILWRLKR